MAREDPTRAKTEGAEGDAEVDSLPSSGERETHVALDHDARVHGGACSGVDAGFLVGSVEHEYAIQACVLRPIRSEVSSSPWSEWLADS